MKYSNIALKVLAAKECGVIKSNAQFCKAFSNRAEFEAKVEKDSRVIQMMEKLSDEWESFGGEGFICIYDEEFPVMNPKVKNKSEKPHLFFYKGNLSLLEDLNKNMAIIGLLDPDEKIRERESDAVRQLVGNGLVIVSGLATGCDTIAHEVCLEMGGETIAILPSQINKIYPAENQGLADKIVDQGGLLLSEYYKGPTTKYGAIGRLIERDRLQAMFAKAILLVASYRKGEGDSGSRHAMEAARKYEIERYAMYNAKIDKDDKQFGLNKDLVNIEDNNKVMVFKPSSITHIKSLKNLALVKKPGKIKNDQLKLL